MQAVELLVDEWSRVLVVPAPERFRQASENVGDRELAFRFSKSRYRVGAIDKPPHTTQAVRVEHQQTQVSQFAFKRGRLIGEILAPSFAYAQPERRDPSVRPDIRTAIHPKHSVRSPAPGAGYSSYVMEHTPACFQKRSIRRKDAVNGR